MLSPSRRKEWRPRWSNVCSRAVAIVDLPDAERPVNQTVAPDWPRSSERSAEETAPGWKVMLVALTVILIDEDGEMYNCYMLIRPAPWPWYNGGHLLQIPKEESDRLRSITPPTMVIPKANVGVPGFNQHSSMSSQWTRMDTGNAPI